VTAVDDHARANAISSALAAAGPPPDLKRRVLDETGQVIEDVTREQIEALVKGKKFFWLDLPDVGDEEVGWLRDVFGFHPLAIEDVEHFGERPKIEEYDGYVTLVLYGSGAEPADPTGNNGTATNGTAANGTVAPAAPGSADDGSVAKGQIEALSEVHCFLSEQYLVTVHRGHCPAFGALLARAHARKVPVTEPSRLFYRVADTLVDSFFPVLAELDDRIDTLQSEVIAHPDNEQLGELLGYRSALIALRRVVAPQRDLFAALSSQVTELPGFDDDQVRYLRDVYDHLIRLSDMIDGYRDLLSGTTDAYLSVVSNQLNVVMKQLAIISTVFLPLSFITGFFGQNFTWVLNRIGSWESFVVLGLGSEVVAVALLVILFRRRGWIGGSTT
jgi:magnesium transporter